MAEVIWSPQAASDLEAICEFIAKDSERYAALFAQRIVDLADSLACFPRSGRVLAGEGTPDLRQRIVGVYRLVYRIRGDDVEIVSIVHGARHVDPGASRHD